MTGTRRQAPHRRHHPRAGIWPPRFLGRLLVRLPSAALLLQQRRAAFADPLHRPAHRNQHGSRQGIGRLAEQHKKNVAIDLRSCSRTRPGIDGRRCAVRRREQTRQGKKAPAAGLSAATPGGTSPGLAAFEWEKAAPVAERCSDLSPLALLSFAELNLNGDFFLCSPENSDAAGDVEYEARCPLSSPRFPLPCVNSAVLAALIC